ncbi:MAG TPA: hypothetical protein VFV58_12575 [Blastocatellia bacterium]|nr:hypothetical protein [Blastocatellia bacterium]
MTKSIPTVIQSKVYVHAFGQLPCSACGRKTHGKLGDYVRGVCGTYYENLTPLCARCHRRITKAAAEAVKEVAR